MANGLSVASLGVGLALLGLAAVAALLDRDPLSPPGPVRSRRLRSAWVAAAAGVALLALGLVELITES